MKFLYRYEKCIVLSIPVWKRRKIEFIWAPAGYTISPHSHNNVDIKLFFIFGKSVEFFRKKKRCIAVDKYTASFPRDFFRKFTIRAGDIHYFSVSNTPLIFMNYEKWHIKPTSAAEDLQLTGDK